MQTVTFPGWPTWNWQFPERDVPEGPVQVRYFDAQGAEQTLPEERFRVARGTQGVTALVFVDKHDLPKLAPRPDAVRVEYEAE